ncbi:MAG: tRNA (adenosine(37)-N6)-threonylcarbamoyltransferase complex transferase subunit TsaD [Planctomycetota bacterium]
MTAKHRPSDVLVLGLETSCDETAASIVEDGRLVRSSVVSSQHDLHAEYGGIVPEIASRAHVERMLPVVRRAIAEADIDLGDVDAIAVGHRPGLIGSLLVGVAAAKALAWSLGKPVLGIDHVHAHLYAGLLGDGQRDLDEVFPALGLVVSGGHTAIYRCAGPTDLVRLGATIDDALGEAYDKAATILGIPHPGGPNLDVLASEPFADPAAVELPVSTLGRDSLDFSFSGLKTSLLYTVRGIPRPKREGGGYERDHTSLSDDERRDLAACFQRAACRAIVLKLERSIGRQVDKPRTLLAGGGVTANSRLRRELESFAERHGLGLCLPEMRFCVDNAAMIAGLASVRLARGEADDLTLVPVPTTAC